MSGAFTTDMPPGRRRAVALILAVGMGLSVVLAAVVSYQASTSPDGLESVARETGFADREERSAAADSPLADYGVDAVASPRLSVGLAGVLGLVATAAIGFGLFRLLTVRRSSPDRASPDRPSPDRPTAGEAVGDVGGDGSPDRGDRDG